MTSTAGAATGPAMYVSAPCGMTEEILNYAHPVRRPALLLRHALIAMAWLVAGAGAVALLCFIQTLLPVRAPPIPAVLIPVVFVLLPVLAYMTHHSRRIACFVLIEVIVLAALVVTYAILAGSVPDPNWK
jgi:hypothetical protein